MKILFNFEIVKLHENNSDIFFMKHSSEHCPWRRFLLRCGRADDNGPAMPVI
jgi:hypothetical protein